MKNKIKLLWVAPVIIAVGITIPFACKVKKETVDPCAGISASYSKDVQPIIEANCYKCHGMGSKKGDFSTYEGLNKVVTSGEFEEKVIESKTMPPNNPLPDDKIKILKCWLKAGHPNN